MVLRSLTLAVAASLLVPSAAHALVPRSGPRVSAERLTAMPAATTKPLRLTRTYRQGPTRTRAWDRFTATTGATWEVSWDAATGVPNRIWGSGVFAFGANASAAIAERVARQVLADHLALLAPGAALADFALVSNHDDGEIRSVGFIQRSGGRRVLGGQVSFRFKRDRLFVIGSEALPNVTVAAPRTRMARGALIAKATAGLRAELALPLAPVSPPGDEVIVPFVGDAAVLGYRVATPVTIDGGADGRYLAYLDPATGGVLAVHQLNTYANGTVLFRGVDRHPGNGRVDRVAPRARVTIDGTETTTSAEGTVSWGSETAKTLTLSVKGDYISVVSKVPLDAQNPAAGFIPPVVTDLLMAPGGQIVWDASATEQDDAQVAAYIAANAVKEFVRTHIDANLPKLDQVMLVNTNIQQDCNAYFDGQTINFFRASAQCQNTALLEDVVFHEYGHNLHTYEIIEGVGAFDGAMSEGASDFLAASMTNDAGMGRGFFFTDTALRDLDPVDKEWIFPTDVQEIHHTGMIYGGALWDLRKTLIAQLGEIEGVRATLKIYLGTLRRSIDIPSSLIEALAVDDDDGNLANGTPNECAIRDAFGRHGLRTATGSILAPPAPAGAMPGTLDSNARSTTVRIEVTGLSDRCGGDEIAGATLGWRPTYTGMPAAGTAEATRTGVTTFYAALPLALDESVMYRTKVHFEDGTDLTLADNLGDEYYQLYQGHTVPLYCTSFDATPFGAGWTTGTNDPAVESPWKWTDTFGGATDPPRPFTGSHALVQGVGGDYPAGSYSYLKLPKIDVRNYSDVRLQYRRWLATEDAYYDQAQILANGKRAWRNTSANKGDDSSLHHIDREWRFHDVALSGYFTGRELEVTFDLMSDDGLELGGWAIDDLCIVANTKSVCGDGIKSPTEVCDNGQDNADLPNQCRSYCRAPTCGDLIVDDGEQCDAGVDGSTDCNMKCETLAIETLGCSSGGSTGALVAGALAGLVMLRRRRRG